MKWQALQMIVVALVVGLIVTQFVSCEREDQAQRSEVDKAAIAAGLCRDDWGRWNKCK